MPQLDKINAETEGLTLEERQKLIISDKAVKEHLDNQELSPSDPEHKFR